MCFSGSKEGPLASSILILAKQITFYQHTRGERFFFGFRSDSEPKEEPLASSILILAKQITFYQHTRGERFFFGFRSDSEPKEEPLASSILILAKQITFYQHTRGERSFLGIRRLRLRSNGALGKSKILATSLDLRRRGAPPILLQPIVRHHLSPLTVLPTLRQTSVPYSGEMVDDLLGNECWRFQNRIYCAIFSD